MDTDLDKIGINQKNKQKIKTATTKTNIHSLFNILKAYNANTHQDKPKLTDTEGTGRLQLAVDTRQTLGKRPPSTPPKTTSVYIHKSSPLPEKGKNGSPKNTEPYRTHEHPPQCTYSSNAQDNNIGTGWSINFETAVPGYDQFRFATGDGIVWLITTKAGIGGKLVTPNEFYADGLRDIIASSDSSTPYQARWYYRNGNQYDPWISVIDNGPAEVVNKILFAQGSASGLSTNVLSLRIGANVFILKLACLACPANTTSPVNSSSINACVCNAGTYRNTGCTTTVSTLQKSYSGFG
jgi:hypothetical protein